MSGTPELGAKMPERWHIKVCPGCNGLVGEMTQTHLGGCEYRDRIFVPRDVVVSPAMAVAPRDFPWSA